MSNSLCNKSKYQITVVGMGYVGLSVAVMLAQRHEIFLEETRRTMVTL